MSTINNASRAMAFLPLAFSVVLMMIGVNLGLTLYPYLFLGEPMMSVGPVFGVLVGLWIGACFSIATWKWSRGPKVERSTSHLAIQRLKKLLIPVVAFLSGSAAMASAGAVGPILDLGVESSLTVPLMLLVSSGGGFALLVTIGLMVAWLHELDWFRDSPEIDRGRDSGAL